MKKEIKSQKKFTEGLLLIYLIVISWIILLKMQFDISLLKNMNFRNVNLIPFAGSAIVNGQVFVSEIILNIVIFIPFGLYISMLNKEWGIIKKVAPVFGVSLAFEVLQYIFAIGGSDITDLLGNTLGGIIGIGVFWILSKILKERTIKILNVLALIGTIVVVGFFGLIIISNI